MALYENRHTDREQTENSITEATLIPVDHQGEWTNNVYRLLLSLYGLTYSEVWIV